MSKHLTPLRAIRKHCVDCVGLGNLVKDCDGDTLIDGPCMLYKYRNGRGRPSVKLIRKYCVNHCMGGHPILASECESKTCDLFPYRMGKSPNKVKSMTPEQLESLRLARCKAIKARKGA